MAPMPKREKVFVGVLIGLIIIIAGILIYAHQKKIWFFSGAEAFKVHCGGQDIYIPYMENALKSKNKLGCIPGDCSAQERYQFYSLYDVKIGNQNKCLMITGVPVQKSCYWKLPECEYKDEYINNPNESTSDYFVSMSGSGVNLSPGTRPGGNFDPNNTLLDGWVSPEIQSQYNAACAKVQSNKEKCCAKPAPTSTATVAPANQTTTH